MERQKSVDDRLEIINEELASQNDKLDASVEKLTNQTDKLEKAIQAISDNLILKDASDLSKEALEADKKDALLIELKIIDASEKALEVDKKEATEALLVQLQELSHKMDEKLEEITINTTDA